MAHIINPANSISVRLLPYSSCHQQLDLPQDSTVVISSESNEIYREVLQSNINDITFLLNLQFHNLWSVLLWPNTSDNSSSSLNIIAYLDDYFSTQIEQIFKFSTSSTSLSASYHSTQTVTNNSETAELERTLSHKIFKLICRITLSPETEADSFRDAPGSYVHVGNLTQTILSKWTVSEWQESISKILSLPRLMDVLLLYSSNSKNWGMIRRIFDSVWRACEKRYLQDLDIAVDFFAKKVKSIQKKHEKSGGKSKGKSKSVVANGDESAIDDNDVIPVINELEYLNTTVSAFYGLMICGERKIAEILVENKKFLGGMLGCYQVANMIQLSLGQNDSISGATTLLKRSIMIAFDSLMSNAFFQPLGVPPKDSQHRNAANVSEFPSFLSNSNPVVPESFRFTKPSDVLDKLCDFILYLIDESQFDEPVEFLKNATVLIDLEVEYDICERLKYIRDYLIGNVENADDARLEYLIVSVEQMLIFSGNAEIKGIFQSERNSNNRRHGIVFADEPEIADVYHETVPTYDESHVSDEYIHRSSLISQVLDLFPDLGEGFVEACLIAFQDDSETVIMRLLEDNLPENLTKLDRKMQRAPPVSTVVVPPEAGWEIVPYESNEPQTVPDNVLSTRKNIFDGDEFDVFSKQTIDESKVIFGKKTEVISMVDDTLTDEQKKSMIQMASVYDEYDDEYDDTYDSNDIKLAGTIELHQVDEMESFVNDLPKHLLSPNQNEDVVPQHKQEPYEYELVMAYQTNTSVFEVSNRKSTARATLRKNTGLADEQIEGWFRMFQKNPRKDRILERYEWRGEQPEIDPAIKARQQAATQRNRKPQYVPRQISVVGNSEGEEGSEEEDSDSQDEKDTNAQSNATKSSEGSGQKGSNTGAKVMTHRDKQKKQRNKGRGGNHNRKRGAMKKMERSMGGS